jgi:hypothetical protein
MWRKANGVDYCREILLSGIPVGTMTKAAVVIIRVIDLARSKVANPRLTGARNAHFSTLTLCLSRPEF